MMNNLHKYRYESEHYRVTMVDSEDMRSILVLLDKLKPIQDAFIHAEKNGYKTVEIPVNVFPGRCF